jgi:signal transduction histidine kinase
MLIKFIDRVATRFPLKPAIIALLRFVVLVILYISSTVTQAQSFTFASTHPVIDLDSLENWVNQHPQPSLARLTRLIQLERTYTWNHANKVGMYLNEIRQLAGKYNQTSVASATYHYLKGYYYFHQSRQHSAVQHVRKCIEAFRSLNDTSGLIHAYALLVDMQYNAFGGTSTDQPFFKKVYKGELSRLLQKTTNKDDQLLAQQIEWSVMYSEARIGKRLEETARRALSIIGGDTSLHYALYQFSKYLAISYYFQNQPQKSYRQNKAILASLKANQTDELITITYNLSNDCEELKRFTEREMYINKALALVRRYDPLNYTMLRVLYGNTKDIALRQGNLHEALALSDSVLKYESAASNQENRLSMLEQQSQFESEQKQRQIDELNRKQQDTVQQTQLVVGTLGLVVLVISYLLIRLKQANQQLKEVNRSRERFFGIIAHDLRRPLHAFHGMNELVSYYLKTQRYEAIEMLSLAIDTAGSKIQLMLDNLLRWALSQQQTLPYQPQQLQLKAIIYNVSTLFESLSTRYHIRYSVHCQEDLQVYADPNALELILRNLVDNALKAMHGQDGQLMIKAESERQGQVRIQVSDSGTGMTPKQLDKVRQTLCAPMTLQLDETNSGLGLILVSQFVQRNRGHIEVASSLGKGSIFTLVLPVGV